MSLGLLPEHNLLLSASIVVSLIIFVVVEKGMSDMTISCTNESLRKSWQIMEMLSFFLFIFLSFLFWFSSDTNCSLFDVASVNIGFSLSGFLLLFSILFIILSASIYTENNKVSEQDSKECGNATSESTKGVITMLLSVSMISSLSMMIMLGIQLYGAFMA